MTKTATSESTKRGLASIEQELKPVCDLVSTNPKCLDDPTVLQYASRIIVAACDGDSGKALEWLTKSSLLKHEQCRQLLAAIKAIKEDRLALGWCLAPPFMVNENGSARQFVYAMILGHTPSMFEIPNEGQGNTPQDDEKRPDLPFQCLLNPAMQLYAGDTSKMPDPPLPGEFLDVRSAQLRDGGLGEVEVSDGMERESTVYASEKLTRQIAAKIEDGNAVKVRVEFGVATAIHETSDKTPEDFLKYPPMEGPSVTELVFPAWLHLAWQKDIRYLVSGRSVKILLLGPTGTGKTEAVIRVGRDAARRAGKTFVLITISSSHIGSSYIHATERNLMRAIKRAESLRDKGYLAIILFDEADGLLGEGDLGEHTHNRTERLAAQELLSADLPGIGCYLTGNPRRNSWLPSAISRRFRKRVYPRPSRSQIAKVASLYASTDALKRLRMSREEFGGIFADTLFSDDRIVAVARCHSGKELSVRVRDLHTAAPGKVRDLVTEFCFDLEDGEADSMTHLWAMIDREFAAVDLSVRNLYDVTFLTPPQDDTIRNVEIM